MKVSWVYNSMKVTDLQLPPCMALNPAMSVACTPQFFPGQLGPTA